MTIKKQIYRLFLPCIALLASCGKEKAVEPSACFDPTFEVSFSQDIGPIINKSCGSATGCHAGGATPQPAYTDYASIKAKVDDGSLETRVLELREMPPSWGPDSVQITDCERELFKLWIEAGAPNN